MSLELGQLRVHGSLAFHEVGPHRLQALDAPLCVQFIPVFHGLDVLHSRTNGLCMVLELLQCYVLRAEGHAPVDHLPRAAAGRRPRPRTAGPGRPSSTAVHRKGRSWPCAWWDRRGCPSPWSGWSCPGRGGSTRYDSGCPRGQLSADSLGCQCC